MTSWWRSWHGAPTDNKWLVIAQRAKVAPGIVSAVAWALLDHASQTDDRGSVAGFDVETYAAFSGFDEEQIAAVLAAMRSKNVIGPDDRLTNWAKRQPRREDDSLPRVRAFRERAAVTGKPVTQCNAPSRTVTPSNNTEADTDTEAEADTEQNRAEAVEVSEGGAGGTATAATAAMSFDDYTGACFATYQDNISRTVGGVQAEDMADYMRDLYDSGTCDWWQLAVREAVDNNKRNWKYIRTILAACLREHRPPGAPRPNGNGKPDLTAMTSEELKAHYIPKGYVVLEDGTLGVDHR